MPRPVGARPLRHPDHPRAMGLVCVEPGLGDASREATSTLLRKVPGTAERLGRSRRPQCATAALCPLSLPHVSGLCDFVSFGALTSQWNNVVGVVCEYRAEIGADNAESRTQRVDPSPMAGG